MPECVVSASRRGRARIGQRAPRHHVTMTSDLLYCAVWLLSTSMYISVSRSALRVSIFSVWLIGSRFCYPSRDLIPSVSPQHFNLTLPALPGVLAPPSPC
jgi:hypothetical protein